MNFKTFPVASTNLFPAANTTAGGQLLSEYNLRSRETVGTDPAVRYSIGPSYVHSMRDFKLSISSGTSTVLEIAPGRGVFNGHFVELLTPMKIDIVQANRDLIESGSSDILTGDLVVGIRVMYSTVATMADSILVENQDMYEGLQVVILPEDKFKLPSDVPTAVSNVTAHIKLGTFSYIGQTIGNIVDNPDKIRYVDSSRLSNIDSLISNTYVSKTNLNPHRLYTFTTKQQDQVTLDTWCDSTDSLMVWDPIASVELQPGNPKQHTTADTGAQFIYDVSESGSGYTRLIIPHKQIDGLTEYYFPDKILDLPRADYASGSGGTVDTLYTQHIKDIAQQVQQIYTLASGKLRKHIVTLTTRTTRGPGDFQLPEDSVVSYWTPGDYVLVTQDQTIYYSGTLTTSDVVDRSPSTLYVAIPGYVTNVAASGSTIRSVGDPVSLPNALSESAGDCLAIVPASASDTVNVEFVKSSTSLQSFRGKIQEDYIRVEQIQENNKIKDWFFAVSANSGTELSLDPVWLTGALPFATTDVIGGFLNVDASDYGSGYVYRDDDGHLRLLDYELLHSGVLAWQLGSHITTNKGFTDIDELQQFLDDYVNDRIAFPYSEVASSIEFVPNVLHLKIIVPDVTSASTINIRNIDSRFNTSVYLHILSPDSTNSITSNITINIENCSKIRIDSNIPGNPIINIRRSSLYYDASILSRLNIIEELSLWYTRYSESDPDLQVDGMTVTTLNKPSIVSTEDYWSEATPNDNHYVYALKSLTFSTSGQIIGMEMLVSDDTTANIATSISGSSVGKFISSGEFVLPQGSGLSYPENRITKPIKVTGSFVTAYESSSPVGYVIKSTQFTAVTQVYVSGSTDSKGTITFYTDSSIVTATSGILPGTTLEGWASGKFHLFHGGIVN